MILKLDNGYLDFDGDVEVEFRVKLFEQIEDTLGDFSYSFQIPTTSNNLLLLGLPMPDSSTKTIYQEVKCDLMDESGFTLYIGYLRVERINKRYIECSFFSGNSNWIAEIDGQLSDIDFSDLDTLLTEVDIANTWDNEDGIIFPFIDTGTLITRAEKTLIVDDFSGCIFVKTIFSRIFRDVGIKLKGDLFTDPIFNNLLLSRNTKDKDDIDSRSSYARNTSNQSFPDPTTARVNFQDDVNYPYFDGSQNNFSSSRFTADVPMKVRVEFTITYYDDSLVLGGKNFGIYVNGVFTSLKSLKSTLAASNPTYPTLTFTVSTVIKLNAGGWVEGRLEYNPSGSSATAIIYANSTFRVTPTFIYLTTGKSLVPSNWTKQQLVKNVLSLFCCLVDYNSANKTLTIDLFNNIKNKESIDLSEDIEVYETDFEEFISEFSQQNLLTYQEPETDAATEYNIENFIEYSAGEINVGNHYLTKSGTILSSDFKAPLSYINESFSASVERMEFSDLEVLDTQEFTGASSFGITDIIQLSVPDDTQFPVNSIVRITNSSVPDYEGDYVVSATGFGAGYIQLRDSTFIANATGTIQAMSHISGGDDGVYLLVNTKYRLDNVSQYSRSGKYYLQANDYGNVAYAFFNILNTGVPINSSYTQSLSLGEIENPLSYQFTIIDKYWPLVGRILNDPVKLRAIGHIKKNTFTSLTPLRPIRIKTLESNNLYYLNSITGYKSSDKPCEVELIKIS